jgi:hypothetical protein
LSFFDGSSDESAVEDMLEELGGDEALCERVGALWYGFRDDEVSVAGAQLEQLRESLHATTPQLDYRHRFGCFAGACAIATAFAAAVVEGGSAFVPQGKSVLIVTLGCRVSAIEIQPAG